MSEDRPESQVFFLDVIAHSFTPLQLTGMQITPALSIWVNEYPVHEYGIPTSDNDSQIPMYYISDVNRVDPATTAVEITARVAHDEFDDYYYEGTPEDMSDELDALLGTELTLVLPAQIIEIVHALSTAEEGFHIFIHEGEPPMGVSHTPMRNIGDAKAIWAFPPTDQPQTREHVSEAFAAFASFSYQAPWYPVAYDTIKKAERGEDVVQSHIRQAQAMLLDLAGKLAHGEDSSLERLVSLANWIQRAQEYQENQEEGDDENFIAEGVHFFEGNTARTFQFIESFITIVRRTYASTFPADVLAPEFKALSIETVKEQDPDLDMQFADIISSLDFDGEGALEKFNKEMLESHNFDNHISEDKKLMADPFLHGFPVGMSNLEKNFEKDGNYHRLAELLRWNWLSTDTIKKGMKEHSLSSVIVAQVLIIAARSVVHTNYVNKAGKTSISVTFNLVDWISSSDDETMWELPAITPGITHYDVVSLEELMSMTPDTSQDKNKPYLFMVIHQVMHTLFEEGWNLGNLDANLATLDIAPPFLLKVRNLMAEFIEKLDETFREEGIDPDDIRGQYEPEDDQEYDDDESGDDDGAVYEMDTCPFSTAYMKVIQQTSDMDQLVAVASKMIPVMADVSAILHSVTPMHEDWESYRKEYVKNFFNVISSSTTRKI